MHYFLFALSLLGPPVLLALALPGIGRMLLLTTLASWTSTTVATHLFLGRDSDPVGTLLWYFVLVLPGAATVPAAVVATRLVQPRGQLIPAIGTAMLGVVLALAVMLLLAFVRTASRDDAIATSALFSALPAIYAGCGAAYATHLGTRKTA